MSTAYVTGGTGCLGRNLVDELTENGWEVVVLHRKSSDLSRLKGCKVRFREVDLHDVESVRGAIPKGVDAVFHVAANTSHWSVQKEEQWKDNVLATRNLVQASLENKVGRFIFTSTWATHPYQTTDERTAEKIDVPYIRTKRLSELEIYKGIERGLDAVILQPIIVIGAYDYNSYGRIFSVLKERRIEARMALPGRLSFCHARDVAAAHRRAFERGRRCEHYVLGGTYTTWLDVLRRIAVAVGARPPKRTYPRWFLRAVAHIHEGLSFFSGKEPLLSSELVKLMEDSPDVPYPEKRKSKEELGYESRPLDVMIADCHQWLLKEGRI